MRPLILASKSPRRAQLLREAGFQFTVEVFDTEEDFPETMPPEEVAPYLAQRKAAAAAHLIQTDEIILTADSVVILNNRIFNKPADYDEAFYMIRQLAGRQHTVISGWFNWLRTNAAQRLAPRRMVTSAAEEIIRSQTPEELR